MKNRISLMLIIAISFNCVVSFAQTSDVKPKIDNIKKLYKEIKAIQSKLTVKTFDESTVEEEGGESIVYKVFKDKNDLKLITYSYSAGDSDIGFEVYFYQGNPFFIFDFSELYGGEKFESRYYIDNGNLIQLLKGKQNIKPNDNEFNIGKERVKEILSDISKYIK